MYFTTMSSPNLFMNDRTASSTNCHNNTWNFLSRSERRRNSNAGINEIKVHVSVIKWDRVMSNFKRPKNREKLKFPVCFHKLRLFVLNLEPMRRLLSTHHPIVTPCGPSAFASWPLIMRKRERVCGKTIIIVKMFGTTGLLPKS